MPDMFKPLCLALLVLTLSSSAEAGTTSCSSERMPAVQVLGSGGPIADDGRASTAYLVWVDGSARILIDAGGGAFLRSFARPDFVSQWTDIEAEFA